jgi:hypothetical protein
MRLIYPLASGHYYSIYKSYYHHENYHLEFNPMFIIEDLNVLGKITNFYHVLDYF